MIFSKPYKLVIIDDDKEILDLIKLYIGEAYFNDLDIMYFLSGVDAFEYIENHQVHIVICDIHLPHSHGVYLMDHILRLDKGIQLIALSADQSVVKATQCFNIGVKFFIDKPVSKDRLKNCLNNCLQHLNDWHDLVSNHLKQKRENS